MRPRGSSARSPPVVATRLSALAFLLLLPALPCRAAGSESPAPAPSAERFTPRFRAAFLWSLVPGGGHFYLGDAGTGVAYAGLTTAFIATGFEVHRRNDELGRTSEVNVPWIVSEKVWEYSIFTTFRSALARDGVDLRVLGVDDTPTARLLASPFMPEQFLRPAVFGAALLGIAGAAIAAHDRERGRLIDVSRARMFGDDFNRDEASALYGASALSVSLGAATAEEGLFRGALQPALEDALGPRRGLWATSGLFGLAHIVAPDGSLNVEGVLFGTAAGAYLGWLYDRDDHRLAGPIAAHFWYDFGLLATSWALDPDDTPFGFRVEFAY